MLWKWFLRALQKLSEWTDLPTRWWRQSDIRLARPVANVGRRWKITARLNRLSHRTLQLVAQAIDSPVRWFRRIRPVGRKQPNKVSWFERAEGAVSRFLLALLWLVRIPLDRIERLFGKPKKVASANPKLAEKQLKLALKRKVAEKLHRDRLAKSWPGRIGRYFIIPTVGFFNFIRAYTRTRTLAVVWWGIPVTIAFGLLLSVYFQVSLIDYSQLAVRYEVALAEAVKAGNSVEASRFRLKLEQLGVRSDRGEYRQAMALSESGDIQAAYEKMRQIAPPSRPGFPGAHFWIVESLLDDKLSIPPEQAAGIALQHISQLKTRVGDVDHLWFLEGLAHFRLGELEIAKSALRKIGRDFPPASALLLEIHILNQDQTSARTTAVALHRQLQQLVNEGKELTADEQRWRVAASQVIGDETMAVAAVDDWYRSFPESRAAKLNRATLLLRQVDSWLQNPETTSLEQTAARLHAAAGLLTSDDERLVFDRMNQIAGNPTNNPIIATLFSRLLTEPDLEPSIHSHLGSLAAARGLWPEAERLLTRATEASPELSKAWNNLAFVLNSAFPARRGLALECSNRAIELEPQNPDFHQTRGTIYFNMRRWDQAIEDLEVATNGANDRERIHQMLAQCYRQVGNLVLAEIYQNATNQ